LQFIRGDFSICDILSHFRIDLANFPYWQTFVGTWPNFGFRKIMMKSDKGFIRRDFYLLLRYFVKFSRYQS